ncbi:MAG: hypothetical protein P0120_05890 [Nitrospira sp.]|nr:hypothetical protein [Nitrospira sp.]
MFVGDTVNVVSPVGPISAMGMVPKIRTFAVVALFHSGMFEYDSSFAYIELGEAQKFFNLGASVTGIEVKVTDVFRAGEIAHNIEQELGFSHGARDWMQMNRNLFSALKLEKTMMFLLLVLITIVASFNIVSTLTMIVTEKQKENRNPQGHGRHEAQHPAHLHAERIDHRICGDRHRHSLRLCVSLAHSNVLDIRPKRVLHLDHSSSCAGRGRAPGGRLRHPDQLFGDGLSGQSGREVGTGRCITL